MKKIVIPLVIVVLVFIISCFVPISWNISKAMPAQVIENISDGVAIDTEVTVEGKYSFYLFKPDRFEGKIEITAFPETAGKNVDIKVTDATSANLVYRSYTASKLKSDSFGVIQADFGMKQIIIIKSNEDGAINLDGEQTCVILAGDSNLGDAWSLLEDLQTAK